MNSIGRRPLLFASVAIAFSLVAACETTPEKVHVGDAAEGRRVAGELCAGCHAIEPGQVSPNAAAPPFSQLLDRYGVDALARDLDDSKSISYLRMPTFHFGEGHAADIVAYLQSLSPPQK